MHAPLPVAPSLVSLAALGLCLALACGGGGPSQAPQGAASPVIPTPPTTSTVQALPFSATDLPAGLAFKGVVVDGARFQDKNGDNLILLTRVAPFKVKRQPLDDNQPYDAELYGHHFVQKDGGWEPLWTIRDFERNCTFDITCDFVAGSLEITDLDKDGEAESWFLYRTACRSDLSPATQKLLMHEGATKYALRGLARIDVEGESYGGEYTVDPAFNGAPSVFLAGAKARWERFELEG